MAGYKLLIFDFDGTLIDSKKDITYATNKTLVHLGLKEVSEEVVADCIGSGVTQLMQKVVTLSGGGLLDSEKTNEALSFFRDFYRKHCLDHTTWYPSVSEGLKKLSNKYILSLLTNKNHLFTDPILEGLGGASIFRGIVCGGDDGFPKKPHPAGAFHLASLAGCRISETLMAGDSIIDLQTAESAGMNLALATYGLGKADEIHGSNIVLRFNAFSELVDYLIS